MRLALAATAALWLLSGCARQDTGGVRLNSDLVSMVPDDALHLMGADFAAIRQTEVYRKLTAKREIPQLERFARETGLDPRRDLDEFLIASDGKTALVMARGRFKKEQLEQKLVQQGASSATFNGHRLLASNSGAVSFLNGEVVVGGSEAAVKAALQRAGHSNRLPEHLARKLTAITGAAQLWAVNSGGLPPLDLPQSGNLGNLHKIYSSLESAVFTVDFREGVKLSAEGECTDEASGKQVHGALRALVGLGRLSTPDNRPELLRFFDGIEITQQSAIVKVKADFPIDMVEQVLSWFPSTP